MKIEKKKKKRERKPNTRIYVGEKNKPNEITLPA